MKKVILRGPLLTSTGYGNHARQVFESLKVLDIDLYVENTRWGDDIRSYLVNKKKSKEILKYCNKKSDSYDMSFQVLLPNEWDKNIADYNVGVTAGIETSYCEKSWIEFANKMDRVIVPSLHAKSSFLNSAKINNIDITTDIDIIPLFLSEEFYSIKSFEKHDFYKNCNTSDNYLIVGKTSSFEDKKDRKSILSTVSDINEYYKTKIESCTVFIKTSISRNSSKDINMFKESFQQEIFSNGKYIDVVFITGTLTDYETRKLYDSSFIKAFVLLTKGECFCIPALEAAVSGLPVIATNWSAHTEYLKSYNGYYPVDYKLKEVEVELQFIEKKSLWAFYDKTSFFDQISKLNTCSALNIHSKTVIMSMYKKVVGVK
jgi:glycosyltransferase involved in cell wall biosynthesis